MDWHKLQQTLYNLDPTDPSEDLAKLRDAAQASAKMSEPRIDYLSESVDVPQGSLTMDRDYSMSDFAALAGIRLDERQKHGDYARGSDPMPKAKPGRTKHPLKDKLVGEAPLDGFARGYQAGQPGGRLGPDAAERAAGNLAGKVTTPSDSKQAQTQKPKAQRVKSSVTGAQLGKQIGVSDPNAFNQAVLKVQQGQPLNRLHQAAMSDAFVKLMAMNPQDTQRIMQLLKRSEARTESQDKPTQKSCGKCGQNTIVNTKKGWYCSSCDTKSTTNESIKDMLYARLANKK